MTSPAINQDMILEILSRFPTSEIGKSRILNKECNKKTYECWFLNLNLHRTNSISGYLIVKDIVRGCKLQTGFVHEMRDSGNNQVSFEFLPQGKAKIKACDASHGILLCLNETGPSAPDYIVCKPTTKQYQIIPKPIMHNIGVSYGLAVIGSNPFRYKILRLSWLPCANGSRRTFACEVFDSGTFIWKRMKNLRLPKTDGLLFSKPVQASGFLHWLSWDDNVIRFCLKTERWSFFKTPKFGVSPKLVRYEGKLGVFRWSGYGEGFNRLWVLKSSFEKSWVKVKDVKNLGSRDDVLWTPSNDVVTLNSRDRICFYNTNTKKLKTTQINEELTNYICFPFCSDFERVDMDERRDGSEKRNFVQALIFLFFFFLFMSSFIQSSV